MVIQSVGKECSGMKKAYTQPDILFESFALSVNIASDCTRNFSGQYSGTCGLHFGNKIVFTFAATGCYTKAEDGSPQYDYICYHIPTGDNRLFNS